MTDINDLREKAKAALIDWNSALKVDCPTPEGWDYITACHPANILALLDRMERLEGLLQKARDAIASQPAETFGVGNEPTE